MAFFVPFIPYAGGAIVSAVSGAAGYYGYDIWKGWHSKKSEQIKADIIKKMNQDYVRIIFVGPHGRGKSSLINTFISAMENRRFQAAVTSSESKSISKCFWDYYIEKDGSNIITLLDTRGFAVTDEDDKRILENIKRALQGKLPYQTDMLEEQTTEPKNMESINIVVFVYSAKDILGDNMKTVNDTMKYIHDEVTKMNIANMLVLTHADCVQETKPEILKEEANKKLGFNKVNIQLIKCLVDLEASRGDTGIQSADRFQALNVLYTVIYDAVDAKDMEKSRQRNRNKKIDKIGEDK